MDNNKENNKENKFISFIKSLPSKTLVFFKTLPKRLSTYFKEYFKTLNYPFWIAMILVAVGLFLFDYFSKQAAFEFMVIEPKQAVETGSWPVINQDHIGNVIIPHLIEFDFTLNNGAAWGALSGQMVALTILSMCAVIFLSISLLFRFSKISILMRVAIVLMLPGALGNLIDRMGCLTHSGIYQWGVIDFLSFSFWKDFPICNLADYFLSTGAVLLIISVIIEFIKEYKQLKLEEKAELENLQSEQSATDEEKMKQMLSIQENLQSEQSVTDEGKMKEILSQKEDM